MAQTKENIHDIGAAFYLCSQSDGNCSPLSREELRQLIEEEFEEVMENPQDPKTVKKVLRFLDDDRNRRVDFRELLSLVFRTAKACYKPLQPGQGQEDGPEPAKEEKAGGEQPSGLRTAGRDKHQTQEGETPKKDQDKRQKQEGETPKQGQGKHQTQQGETPKQDGDKRQTQEGKTPKQDGDKRQKQEGETPKQDGDKRQTQQGETPKQDNHQDDRTGAPQGDPKRGETLDTTTPRQDRNTHKAEETKTPKPDPKTHQTKETEAPQQGSNHRQSPERESAQKDPNCPSETRGRDPKDKTQVCKATNPDKTQKLLPPQRGTSPRRDYPKPWGTHHDSAFHWLPESKVLEEQKSGAGAPSRPAQQHQDSHKHKQPIIDQQVLQSLYQWPPQQ
ncbi:CRNN protein, partial [Nycticryphes semicollaris]|nr:CRNN protein [Nycticryphes semicollaris]